MKRSACSAAETTVVAGPAGALGAFGCFTVMSLDLQYSSFKEAQYAARRNRTAHSLLSSLFLAFRGHAFSPLWISSCFPPSSVQPFLFLQSVLFCLFLFLVSTLPFTQQHCGWKDELALTQPEGSRWQCNSALNVAITTPVTFSMNSSAVFSTCYWVNANEHVVSLLIHIVSLLAVSGLHIPLVERSYVMNILAEISYISTQIFNLYEGN